MKHRCFQKEGDEAYTQVKVMEPKQERGQKQKTRDDLSGTQKQSGTSVQGPTCQCRLDPWVRKTPQRRAQHPVPVFLPGESHRQRNLAGCNPQSHMETDVTEANQHTHTYIENQPVRIGSTVKFFLRPKLKVFNTAGYSVSLNAIPCRVWNN